MRQGPMKKSRGHEKRKQTSSHRPGGTPGAGRGITHSPPHIHPQAPRPCDQATSLGQAIRIYRRRGPGAGATATAVRRLDPPHFAAGPYPPLPQSTPTFISPTAAGHALLQPPQLTPPRHTRPRRAHTRADLPRRCHPTRQRRGPRRRRRRFRRRRCRRRRLRPHQQQRRPRRRRSAAAAAAAATVRHYLRPPHL